ncbi:MAG TPA: chorismate mutase [Acetivibrio sp.]|jgi:isochorismate pyruvate lyase|nr:chorismate mutase [Clostridium sp.]HOQ02101.1 chorismate mutase [Acetivibrio clariflavus]HQA57525.1 chorismate mutase [Acetivibrio sp.]
MECKSLEEVRNNIDRIDAQIVKLIAERGSFVKQASKFKKDSNDVKAPQRVEAVIQKVRNLATDYGADPDMIEQIYRVMISGFINMEMDEFKKHKEL